MNKNLYSFGISFLGLTIVCSLFQSLMQILFGDQFYTQNSFVAWFLVANTISLIGGLFLLKYYHFSNYWVSFYTLIVFTIINFSHAGLIVILLTSRAFLGYYVTMVLISLSANIAYAISLLFSITARKFWLKIAGAFMLAISLFGASTIIIALLSNDVQLNNILKKITAWISIPASLSSLPFIMQFSSEIKLLNSENSRPIKKYVKDTLEILRSLALIATVALGAILTAESISGIYWGQQIFEKNRKMAQLFNSRTYVSRKGDTLFYHLLKPLKLDPTKKYPLVVSLPYGGQPSTDKVRQIEGAVAAEVLSNNINRTKYPAYIFIPNCPPGAGWGGIPNYPAVDSLVYEAISSLNNEPGIDVNRRYVVGLSRGGFGAWHFICTRPDMFAAAIPIAGGEDPRLAGRIINVPVWAFHGAKDKNAPVSGSRNMINAIKKAGGNPRYTEFPNDGHNIWDKVNNTPGIWDWLFAQKKCK